jgi:hypothetical protein
VRDLSDTGSVVPVDVNGCFGLEQDSRFAREWRLGNDLEAPLLLEVTVPLTLCLLSSLPGICSERSVSVPALLPIEHLRLVRRLELPLDSTMGYRSFM